MTKFRIAPAFLMRLICVLGCFASLGVGAQTRNLEVQPGRAQRIALVIGNDSYRQVEALRNARTDARAIARALEEAGFTVMLRLDVGEKQMKEAMRQFKSRIGGGDEAVFYFSGHGVQLGAANYLLPTDIEPRNEDQIKDDALPLQRVLDDLQEQKAKFSLAVIDACRNNPFRGVGRSLGGRGLAPTSAATGQMVIYSAGTGQQALDRLGNADPNPNGVFTRVFLKEMSKPGVPVDRVLRGVREEVVRLAKSIGHEQVPALYDQALGEFYFRPPRGAVGEPPSTSPATATAPVNADLEFWRSIRESGNPEEFRAYLRQFPQGEFAGLAQVRLAALRRAPEATPHPAPAATQPQAAPSPLAPSPASGTGDIALAKRWSCMACHSVDKKVVGPAFRDVAQRYSPKDRDLLVDKVRNGGKGAWGQIPMPANPAVPQSDLISLIDWVLAGAR